MFRLLNLTVLALIGTVGLSLPAHAKIYKYVDQNGNVVYSQSKPKNIDAKEVKPRVRKVSPEDARKQLEALEEKANNAGKNREVVEKTKAEVE